MEYRKVHYARCRKINMAKLSNVMSSIRPIYMTGFVLRLVSIIFMTLIYRVSADLANQAVIFGMEGE